ncbi:hypothetical protein I656_02597 [Geobacillus sp. WSUCF1]|nr:hypothetical protein I656_02597 [Geobacillus sp. WSUCF1]
MRMWKRRGGMYGQTLRSTRLTAGKLKKMCELEGL